MSYRLLIEGAGPPPTVTWLDAPPLPAPTPPPPPPPAPPPPPPPQPFIWPTDSGPLYPMLEGDRTAARWLIHGRSEDDPAGWIFAALPGVGRPSSALSNAGFIAAGRLAGLRVWAPKSAPDAMLHQIIDTGVWP